MPYNPSVNDRSGEILASYQMQAAKQKQEQNDAMWNKVSDGITGSIGTMTSLYEKSQAHTAKLQGAQATVQAMQSILPQYGDQGIALGDALTKDLEKAGTNADKISGTIMAYQPAMQSLIQTDHSVQVANAQGKNYQALAQIKADAKTVADPKLDANYARQSYQGLRERGYNHDQAIEGMKASGLNWGTQYIDRPADDGFFRVTR